MPKTLHHSIRKDSYMRIRLTDSFLSDIKMFAKKKGVTLSDLVRDSLQKELDKEKTNIE